MVSRGRATRAQALAEMGIILLLFVTLVMGMLEFGRAWMVANMITHATRDGARMAAVVPASNRDGSGHIANTSSIITQVQTEVADVLGSQAASNFTVSFAYPTAGGVPMVAVTTTGSVPYLFNLVGTSFDVSRTITFRDEAR